MRRVVLSRAIAGAAKRFQKLGDRNSTLCVIRSACAPKANRFQQLPLQFRFYSTANSNATNALVLIEHNGTNIVPSTLAAITAATKIGGNVTAIVFTSNKDSKVPQTVSTIKGIGQVLHYCDQQYAHPIAEILEPAMLNAIERTKCSHLIAAHTAFGKNLVPRLAGALDVSPVSDVTSVLSSNQYVRFIYAGNAVCQVESTDKLQLLTVRGTAFDKATVGDSGQQAPIESVDSPAPPAESGPQFVSEQLSKSDRPELTSAQRIVSGGRALKSSENFTLLYELADTIGAAVGATRAAVDAGYVPNDMQVGQTGKVVAPELYIAVGISGAIQHLAGMKDSKCIVAVNKDAEAPIFQVADFGIVGDLFKVVPELTQKLKQ